MPRRIWMKFPPQQYFTKILTPSSKVASPKMPWTRSNYWYQLFHVFWLIEEFCLFFFWTTWGIDKFCLFFWNHRGYQRELNISLIDPLRIKKNETKIQHISAIPGRIWMKFPPQQYFTKILTPSSKVASPKMPRTRSNYWYQLSHVFWLIEKFCLFFFGTTGGTKGNWIFRW